MEGVSAGDERWVHVLYFLSRDGKVEQPHLMRVLPRRRRRDAALRLRDVKRWMSELRGMGMPDSFAWACKRRYKTGYVWEDLADDDAITPVSGGEYVLMGSIVTAAAAAAATEPTSSSSSSSTTFSSAAATARSAVEAASATLADPKTRRPYEKPAADNPDGDLAASRVDDDDGEEEEEEEEQKEEEMVVGEAAIQNPIRRAAAAFRAGPDHRAGGAASATSSEVEEADPTSSGEEDAGRDRAGNAGGEGGCRGGRGPRAFWNLLGCGADAARTHDSALLPLNPRRRRGEGAGRYCNSRRCHGGAQAEPAGEREARRSRGGRGSPSRSRVGGAAAAAAAATVMASKPVACPHCSQCGRSFRPERLHSHMKSCRALKGQRKSMGSGKLQQRAGAERAMPSEETAPLFLLGH